MIQSTLTSQVSGHGTRCLISDTNCWVEDLVWLQGEGQRNNPNPLSHEN